MRNDSYEILEVSKQATIQDIESAYRAKVRKCHPDLGGNAEDFKIITAAYEYLKKTSVCEACGGEGQQNLKICPFVFTVPCGFCGGSGRNG